MSMAAKTGACSALTFNTPVEVWGIEQAGPGSWNDVQPIGSEYTRNRSSNLNARKVGLVPQCNVADLMNSH